MRKVLLLGISIILLSLIFLSFKAGDITSQFTGDENFYFQSSQNMISSGDWLTPRYYGKPRFQKPILYYWLVAVSLKIFGIGWFGARFPSVLFASLTILFTFLIGKNLFERNGPALLSAFILATTFKFFKYARTTIPDMALLCFMTISLYIFLKIVKSPDKKNRFLWPLFFLSLALATLIKGPIGIIVPLLAIFAFILISKERVVIGKANLITGIFIFLSLVLPWFLVMLKIHGDAFTAHIWSREITHRIGYFSDTKNGVDVFLEYLKTLPFYIPILIVRFLPWSLLLPSGIARSLSAVKSGETRKEYALVLGWFLAVFFLFTLVGEKHSQYMLALTPPFALMIGANFVEGSFKKRILLPVAIILITAFSISLLVSNKGLRLNNAIMGSFAYKIISHDLDDNDSVAVGSHELIPQHLEAHLNRPVKKIGGKWYDPEYHDRVSRNLIESFYRTKAGTFCIINKDDFTKHVSADIKKRLKILHKGFMWRRKIRITKDQIALLFKEGIGAFLDSYKREYYLVTDK